MPYNEADDFMRSAQAYAPMSSMQAPNMSFAFQGVPFISDNPMMGLLLQGTMSNFMGASGMSPMGFHGQNIYDTMKNQMFWQQQMAFQAQAQQADRDNWMRTARGFAAISGTPWGTKQIASAGALADIAAGMSPILAAVAPDFLDRLGGVYGSQYVMRSQIGMANRYRIDPVTGMLGGMQRAGNQEAFMNQLWSDMYGPGVDVTSTRGVPAGEAGQLYAQMQMRGMLPGFSGTRDMMQQYARFAGPAEMNMLQVAAADAGFSLPMTAQGRLDPAKMSATQVSSLLGNENVANSVRAFDATRVSEKLKNYLDTVNAMRDIFGDMGRPNAPLPELLNALDMLTAGSLNKLDPGRVTQMVRTTQALAANAGLSMQNVSMLNTEAGMRVAAFGGDPVFAITAAQGAMAFGTSMRGMGIGATPMWGQKTPDQMTQMDLGLRAGAVNSRAFYRTSMASFLNDMYGGFAANSRAGAYMSALESSAITGDMTFVDPATGKARPLILNQAEFVEMFNNAPLAKGGNLSFSTADYNQVIRQHQMLSKYGEQFGYQNLVRQDQLRLDTAPFGRNMITAYLPRYLQQYTPGKSIDDLRKIAAAIGEDVTKDWASIAGTDEFNSDVAAATGSVLGARLKEHGIDLTPEQLRPLGGLLMGSINESARRSGRFGKDVNFTDVLIAQNPNVTSATAREMRQAVTEGTIRSALAPLNRSDPLRRVMTYIQQMEANKDADKSGMGKLISTMLGGVDTKLVNDTLLPSFNTLFGRMKELEVLDQQIAMAETPEERKHLNDQRADKAKEISNLSNTITSTFAPMIASGNLLTAEDFTSAAEGLKAGRGIVDKELAAIPGDSGAARSSAFDRLWRSDGGKEYGNVLRERYIGAENVATQLLTDKTNITHYGLRGGDTAVGMLDKTQKLKALAVAYSRNSGDVAQLVAGDVDPNMSKEERKKLAARVAAIDTGLGKDFDTLQMLEKSGRSGWDLDAMRAKGFTESSLRIEQGLTASQDAELDSYIRLLDRKGKLTSADETQKANLAASLQKAVPSGESLDTMVAAHRDFRSKMTSVAEERLTSTRVNEQALAKELGLTFGMQTPPMTDEAFKRGLQGEAGRYIQDYTRRYGAFAEKAVGKFHGTFGSAMGQLEAMYYKDRSGLVSDLGLDDAASAELDDFMKESKKQGISLKEGMTREGISSGRYARTKAAEDKAVTVNIDNMTMTGEMTLKDPNNILLKGKATNTGTAGVAYAEEVHA